MTIYVHMGMLKTGTTSIQDTLGAAGPLPPFELLAPGAPNASLAVIRAFQTQRFLKNRFGAGPVPDGAAKKFRAMGLRALKDAFVARSQPNVILSAETIQKIPAAGLERLRDFLLSQDEDIRVVGYVRAPKAYAESAFQEQIKRSYRDLRSEPFTLSYRRIFEKFDTVFGPENLWLRKFETARFPEGCVVSDFCDWLGIERTGLKVIRSNTSLSLPAVQLLCAYRKAGHGFTPRDKGLIERLKTLEGPKLRFHSRLARQVIPVAADDIAWIEDRADISLAEDWTAHDETGVADPALIETPGAAATDWLARETDTAPGALTADIDAVIRALAALARAAERRGDAA